MNDAKTPMTGEQMRDLCVGPCVLVPQAVTHDRELSPADKCVYVALAAFAGDTFVCWASDSQIGKDVQKSSGTINGAIGRLERRGHVRREANAVNPSTGLPQRAIHLLHRYEVAKATSPSPRSACDEAD